MNSTQISYPILLIIIPLATAFIIPVLGLWKKQFCYPLTLLASSINLFSSIKVLEKVIISGPIRYNLSGWKPPWGIEYYIDHFGAVLTVLISIITLMTAIYSKKSIEKELPGREVLFYTLYLLLFTGLLGIVLTGDMFNLYVFIEITALSTYALIAIGDEKAQFASFRYLIIGTIGACFYLLGVGYLYISTGTLNMADLSRLLPELFHLKTVLVAFAFFMLGIGIKIAIYPLHVWLPDSYTFAPSSVSALVSPLVTKIGLFVMIKILYTIFGATYTVDTIHANQILGPIAIIAMIVGSIMAIAQTDIKRMLTYVIVAEVGYIALGVAMANKNGLTGAILHIVNDAVMMSCLFLIVGIIVYKTGTRNINEFKYFNRKMPYTMAAFVIGALSMVGVPPACGFFSKWYLLIGALDANNYIFAAAILLIGLFNAILFFRVIEKIYFNTSAAHEEIEIKRDEAPLSMLVPVLVMTSGIILLGVFSGKIVSTVIQYAVPGNF